MKVCSVCHRCYENAVSDCMEDGHPVLYETRGDGLEFIKGYHAKRLLEFGRNGEIYLAHHVATSRTCLIKIHHAVPELRERFLSDANTSASLFHPNVADIYEVGTLDGDEVFIVTEEVQGQTLRDLLKAGGPESLLSMIEIIRGAAEAVHAIHLKGLTHRALRPENIVLTAETAGSRMVRIQNIDLGGVIEHSIISDKFTIDSAVESLRYFAPEQCVGETIGPLTDVYALGIVLYEMLAGRPPFDSTKAAAVIGMHRSQRPPEIRIDDFDLRMLITHTLTESLNKQPKNRQSSANAFARQLRHMEQLATHVSTPPPAVADPLLVSKVTVANIVSPLATEVSSKVVVLDTRADAISSESRKPEEEKSGVSPLIVYRDRQVTDTQNVRKVAGEENPAKAITEDSSAQVWTDDALDTGSDSMAAALPPKESHVHQRLSRLKFRRKQSHLTTPPQAADIVDEVIPELIWRPMPASLESLVSPAAITNRTRKVEWVTPEDDIPTVEDIIIARSDTDSLTSHAKLAIVPDIEADKPVELKIASSAEPVQEIVLRVTATTTPESSAPVLSRAAAAAGADAFSIAPKMEANPLHKPVCSSTTIPIKPSPTLTPTDADEITAVNARSKPIRIQLDPPSHDRRPAPIRKVVPQPSNDIPFSLTLLGARNVAVVDSPESIFARYTLPQAKSFRTVMVGGGVIAALALFLFGNGGAWDYVSTLASSRSVVSRPESRSATSPEQKSVPAVTVTERKPSRYFENPQPKPVETAIEPPKPMATAPKSASSSKSEPTVPSVKNPPPHKPEPAASSSKVKTKPEVKQRSVEKKASAPVKKVDGATRPRIVRFG